MDDMKKYSKKELMEWVTSFSYGPQKFQDIRNGVFFCNMLKELHPDDFVKQKFNEKPTGQYEIMTNLNLMKRILNKYNEQKSLNIYNIMSSKNNYEFVNWFRNYAENNNLINLSKINTITNKKHQTSQYSMQKKSREKIRVYSAKKKDNSSAFTQRKRSRPKLDSERAFQGVTIGINKYKKSQGYLGGSLKTSMTNLNKSDMIQNNAADTKSQYGGMNIMQLLQQKALQENIGQFEKILKKVKEQTNQVIDGQSTQQFKKRISDCIFKRN